MTPEYLAAIRHRVEREGSAPFLYASQGDRARTDRAALLAEVDGLQHALDKIEELTSSDSGGYEHNGHADWEGEPECPGCWVDTLRAILKARP